MTIKQPQLDDRKATIKCAVMALFFGAFIAWMVALYHLGNAARDQVVQQAATSEQAIFEYIREHQCALVDMSRGRPSSYRCDKPDPNTYLEARELYKRALAPATKNPSTANLGRSE